MNLSRKRTAGEGKEKAGKAAALNGMNAAPAAGSRRKSKKWIFAVQYEGRDKRCRGPQQKMKQGVEVCNMADGT